MKSNKILAMVLVLSMAAVGSAYAANGTIVNFNDTTTTVGTPSATVKVSKNVTVRYIPEAAGLTYSMSSFHTSGTKTYATTSGDTKIFMQDSTSIVAPPDAPASGASGAFTSGWTSL